jgi:ribose 5-phosphate isomerase A
MSDDAQARAVNRDAQKRAAAEAAVALVQDGMVVGLGTGSTAAFAIDALARRVGQGLRILGIPTSERSAAQARKGGITLTTLAEHRRIALTIDGADEIAPGSLDLIKGLGGALLREKIVAAASDRLIIVADAGDAIGQHGAGADRGGAVRLGEHGGPAGRVGRCACVAAA